MGSGLNFLETSLKSLWNHWSSFEYIWNISYSENIFKSYYYYIFSKILKPISKHRSSIPRNSNSKPFSYKSFLYKSSSYKIFKISNSFEISNFHFWKVYNPYRKYFTFIYKNMAILNNFDVCTISKYNQIQISKGWFKEGFQTNKDSKLEGL